MVNPSSIAGPSAPQGSARAAPPANSPAARAPSIPPAPLQAGSLPAAPVPLAHVPALAHVLVSAHVPALALGPDRAALHRLPRKLAARSARLRAAAAVASSNTPRPKKAR